MLNNKPDIKLIACDLDGTLLQNGQQKVSKKALHQIKQLKQKNIIFAAASGRQYKNLQVLFAPVMNDIAYICENGCQVMYQNEIINQKFIEMNTVHQIVEDILNTPEYEVQISTATTQYLMPKTDAFYQIMQKEVGLKTQKITSLEQIKEPIIKIAMHHTKGIKDLSSWQKKYASHCRIHYGRYDWADFTNSQANKGSALQILQQHLHISPTQCLAFGDYDNDIEMLQAVAYPVVMSNAPEHIKKYAKTLTDRVENTLEKILSDTPSKEEKQ